MKKYFNFVWAAALAMVALACSKEIGQPGSELKNGERLELVGTAATKVSLGELEDNYYPLLWAASDKIRIWSAADGGSIAGETASVQDGYASKNVAKFITDNTVDVTSAQDIVITYSSSLTYASGTVSGTVEAVQHQASSNSSAHLGESAFAVATASLEAGKNGGVSFTLEHKTAFVKLVLSTSEYSAMNLKSAKLYCKGAALAGEASLDVASGVLTGGTVSDCVGAELETPAAFSGTQEVYFTALPADLTGQECYVIITMEDQTKTVTIPAKINGGKLVGGRLAIITVSDISAASNACDWYEPVETRDLLGAWAYGAQNSYFIEQTASGGAKSVLEFEVKARGDFTKVKKPVYYGLYTGASEMSTRKLIWLPGSVTGYESQPTNTVSSEGRITIYSYNQDHTGHWATVAIYDENYKILWSYMIMKYNTGDEPGDVAYPGTDIVLLDRNLGSTYSNALAEQKKTFDNAGAFFQWGRKDPFMWSNSNITDRYYNTYVTEEVDVQTAIENPGVLYAYVSASNGDWQMGEHRTDLWGGVNNTSDWYDPDAIGHKTIYDPCPEGYRVPDARVFKEVEDKAERWEISNGLDLQDTEYINADSPFAGTFSTLAYPLGDGKYDYWPYAGAKWGSNSNWGNRTGSTNKHGAIYWANSVDPTATNVGIMLEYCYFSAEKQMNNRHTSSRAHGYTIRCQKE
ncbi:MAG: hypothetical protein ACI39U_03065 [Candidatus Cryptobacteroides sp.]